MDQKPNVLLLVLDAVRSDHVSCYGYQRETTPNINMLAEEGVRYGNAIAPSIWTPTVHGAIFTGQYPSHTGIYGDSLNIPSQEETLPEVLSDAGYRTFAASAGAHLRRDRGYARGVDDYVETRRVGLDVDFFQKVMTDRSFAKQIGFTLTRGSDDKSRYKYDRLKRFIDDAMADDDPFFGFVNAKTAHQPFNPPRPYKGMFCEGFERPRYEFLERLHAKLDGEPQHLSGFDIEKLREISHSGGDGWVAGEVEMSEEDWDIIRSWYDGAIRYLDSLVGDLVSHLRETGAYEDTLLIVMSDHGDNFGDHGMSSHNFCLYDSLVHVPLIVKPPGGTPTGRVIDEQVSLVDLEPTIREAADVPRDNYPHTESLLDFENRRYHEYTFSEYAGYAGPVERLQRKFPDFDATQFVCTLQSVRNEEYKLIIDDRGNRELYAWRDDPREKQNLVDEQPDLADELESILEDTFDPLKRPDEFNKPDDDIIKQQLQDLGYI